VKDQTEDSAMEWYWWLLIAIGVLWLVEMVSTVYTVTSIGNTIVNDVAAGMAKSK